MDIVWTLEPETKRVHRPASSFCCFDLKWLIAHINSFEFELVSLQNEDGACFFQIAMDIAWHIVDTH